MLDSERKHMKSSLQVQLSAKRRVKVAREKLSSALAEAREKSKNWKNLSFMERNMWRHQWLKSIPKGSIRREFVNLPPNCSSCD